MAEPAESSGKGPQHLLSLVIPVYNEAENILPLLDTLRDGVATDHETLLVYDFDQDSTLPPARAFQSEYAALRLVKNTLGRGVLNALKTGFAESTGDVIVVTMADQSDDITQIDEMASLIRQGASVVAGSRYMRGGRQLGGPPLKRVLSRIAGLSLHWLTGLGTHDSTNNFKAYGRTLMDRVTIESKSGFELGLELTTKAHISGLEVVEIPTTWRDRTAGVSNFRMLEWLPSYLHWYLVCLRGTWSGKRRRARRRFAVD